MVKVRNVDIGDQTAGGEGLTVKESNVSRVNIRHSWKAFLDRPDGQLINKLSIRRGSAGQILSFSR